MTLADLAIIAGFAAARRVLNSQTAARIADKMAAEGRRVPNAEEEKQIADIVAAGKVRLDEAIAKAESENR